MFRRSRLSVRPNVGSAGRTAATPQEAPISSKDSDPNPKTETVTSLTESKPAENPPDQTPTPGDGNNQNGESTSSLAVQRRKRFSIKPKVLPGRPSALPRTPKSPVKPVLHPAKIPALVTDKSATSPEANTIPPTQGTLSPKENNVSDESSLTKIQAKPIIPPSSSPESVLQDEGASKDINLSADAGKNLSLSCSQVKEVKSQVLPSIPDREANEISEKAKTLVSKTGFTTAPEQFSLSQLLNDRSDLIRLEKSRKLRQLLRQEMYKEKNSKKNKARVMEYSLDPAKMTMRDLIHYLPTSNPMLSSLKESAQENDTVLPQSPGREESPERVQEPEVQPKMLSPRQEATSPAAAAAAAAVDEEADEEAEEEEEALMVPQVKVAEDGSLIIDEESLTVEVQRMKGPNPIQERDPIFERGSTTTYSSFRKGNYSKPWSTEETDMFFLAISMVGTDFSMICQLFPHRARTEIKNKFKKEERYNAWRIDKAFRERRRLDLEYFTKLLEKILEFQQNKKKLKSLSDKNKSPKKRKRKSKKATGKLSDVEEEIEDEICDSNDEEEGEKENENLCNEKMSDTTSKKKCKRKNKDDPSPEQPDCKQKNKRKKKNMQDDVSAPADSEETVLTEDLSKLSRSENTETPESVKDTEDKSDKLLPLSHKGRKSTQSPKSKAVISDKEAESTSEDVAEKQIEKSTSPPKQANKRGSDNDSSDQEITVQPARPSRYGRVPKPVQPLNYPAKEDTHSSASETTPASTKGTAAKAKGSVKRSARQQPAKKSKKPKLITLRASQSECSEESEEEEMAADMNYDENSTAAFVPASLCSPRPVVQEVEETMEELDMLAHMPDVLGMSENALCPDASCKQLENERGTVEPCEHQLDLLVDVIDFLSENTEASEDESYNEAAQTLLTIGSVAAQPTQCQPSLPEPVSSTNYAVFETTEGTEEEGLSKSAIEVEGFTQATPGPPESKNKATEDNLEPHICDTDAIKSSEKPCSTQETFSSPLISAPEAEKVASPAKKGRFSKIKPKPNISRVARTTKLSSKTVCVESQHVDIAATSLPQAAELRGAESETCNSQVANVELSSSTSETCTEENLEILNKRLHLDHKTSDTKADAITSKAASQMQPAKSTTMESEAANQILPQEEKTLKQTKEPELQNRQETHLEKISSANVQCTEKATEDLTPTNITALEKKIGSTDPEPDTLQSNLETKAEHPTTEEETANVAFVNHQLESVPESAKQSTPQRRRRFPKVKPNLVSSPRTTKPREVKDSIKVQPDKSSSLDATSGEQILKETIAQEEAEQGKLVIKDSNTASPVVSNLAVSSGSTFESDFQDKVTDEPTTSSFSEDINSTSVKSRFEQSGHLIEQSSNASISTEEPTKLPKVSENQPTVQEHGEQKATTQENKSSECASSDISKADGTVCERFITPNQQQLSSSPQNTTLRTPDSNICPDSDAFCTLQIAGCEFSTDHHKPLEGAEEPLKVLPPNDAEPLLCLDQVQNSSLQDTTMTSETTFEYPSLIFPDMLPDQVPSDPDEPFFILSLTEIPVCPSSGEVEDARPKPYHSQTDSVAQQSNPVPLAAGIDDSLSHIHIPTPEKAALNTGLVSVEEYLPSTPAVDISILGELQGNVDVGNAKQNLLSKMAAEEASMLSQIETTQESPQLTAQTEVSKSMRKTGENTQESEANLDTGKTKRKAADVKGNKRKTKASCDPESEKQTPEPLAARDEASQKTSTSCTSEIPTDQHDTKRTRGKGKSSRSKKASYETPEAVCADSLKETHLTPSITELSQTQVVKQQSSSQTTAEPPASPQSNSTGIGFSDEEPTNVSQYFLSDVFTEVESGNLDTEEVKKDTVCCNKSPTAAKKQNSDTPCGQNVAQTAEKQPDTNKGTPTSELPVTPSTSSTSVPIVPTDGPAPQDTKETRERGRSNRKIKNADESKAKNSQRKSRAALKLEAVSLDTPSNPSTTDPSQTHEMLGSSQPHLIGGSPSEGEPTNVSQSFISDIFTELKSDVNLAAEKTNARTTLKTQTAKTKGNKRQNRKTKASSDPPSGQKTSQMEAQPAEELALVVDNAASSSLVKTSSPSCATEVHADPSQQDTNETRGRSSRQSRAASKLSAEVLVDNLKETSCTPSTNKESTSQSISEPPVFLESNSMRISFSDEEPTNVSQYFLSDVFTEVEEEDKL